MTAQHSDPVIRWSIGDVAVTRIVEREVPVRIDSLIPAATPQALARHRHWLAPHFIDEAGTHCRLSIHALAIEADGVRIIVDTCIGEHQAAGMDVLEVPTQPFLQQLADRGFARESVDVVLCTHLHFDHVGWNTMRVGGRWLPTFPNARYLFSRREWEHWRDSPERETWTLSEETIAPLFEANLAQLVDMDHRITPQVRLLPTPGHTPGHVSVLIESRGERALITGDMTHHPVQWAEPDWGTVADVDAAGAAATRRDLIDHHAHSGDLLVIGTHYPSPCAGYLTRADQYAVLRT